MTVQPDADYVHSTGHGPTVQLSVRDLVVSFGRGADELRAVDGVSFDVARGTTLGIIGESGSGKSTLARTICGLQREASGEILLAAEGGGLDPVVTSVGRGGRVQMIFQDATMALNPLRPVWKSVVEPIEPRSPRVRRSLRGRAEELLSQVGLPPETADRRPSQMSGGQRQRVTIARAIAANSSIVMCDEPVAALDISLQAGVLSLLDELQTQFGLTYLFISHDMSSIARIADQVGVMYLGQLVEIGPTAEILSRPRHPYTQALIGAVPSVGARGTLPQTLSGETPDARKPPSGCRFRTRCPFATALCADVAPEPESVAPEPGHLGPPGALRHQVACHHWRRLRRDNAEVSSQ